MYFSKNDKKVIKFYCNINEYENEEMLLKWKDGSQIKAKFDTCFDDDNDLDVDDKNYEDFTTFVFAAVETKGNPPVFITKDNYFCINYKNFPEEIFAGGKKIN